MRRIRRLASLRETRDSTDFAPESDRVSGDGKARSAQLPVCVLIRPWASLVHPVEDDEN